MIIRRLLIPLVAVAACAGEPTPHRHEISLSSQPGIDILFVVDTSDSMALAQAGLARGVDDFVGVLESNGDLPDLHLGVVSADVGIAPFAAGNCHGDGDDGLLEVPAACLALTDDHPYIVNLADQYAPGGRRINFATDTMAEQLACMAGLGAGGCGFQQHFESMHRALDGRNGDFLRDDAFLAVVFLQDEDDCSASDPAVFGGDPRLGHLTSFRCFEHGVRCRPDDPRALGPRQDCQPRDDSRYVEDVANYADFLRGLKGDPSRVMVAGIAGAAGPVRVELDPDGTAGELSTRPVCAVCPGGGDSCAAPLVAARPTVRLHALLDAFQPQASVQDICAGAPEADQVNLSGALIEIAGLLASALAD